MIPCTKKQATIGYHALRRLNQSAQVKKNALLVARLVNKLRKLVEDYEAEQIELFLGAGAERTMKGAEFPELIRLEGESDENWQARIASRLGRVSALQTELDRLAKESVEIDYDPLPFSLYSDETKIDANDLADAEFLFDTTK